MPQHELIFIGCPTLEQLRELEQNVKFLKAEKVNLLDCFLNYHKYFNPKLSKNLF